MTAEQILSRAADLVTYSWAQGSQNVRTSGPYCAGIALAVVGGKFSLPQHWAELARASDAFARQIGVDAEDHLSIARWNDAPGRTQAEVATELRNAKRFV